MLPAGAVIQRLPYMSNTQSLQPCMGVNDKSLLHTLIKKGNRHRDSRVSCSIYTYHC